MLEVTRLLIETTDADFASRLLDFLNTASAERSSTMVTVLDTKARVHIVPYPDTPIPTALNTE